MAKVGLWLRGARGKYAGGVLQKGENGTTVRENVTPVNAQTRRQMYQRVAFATAAKAANFLLPVIGQSFEGYKSEKANRRRFMALNGNLLKNIYALSETEGDYMETMAYAIDKSQKTLVPNPYIVSAGSLAGSKFFNVTKDYDNTDGTSNDFFKGNVGKIEGVLTGKSYTAADLWRGLFDIRPRQQVTFVAILTRNDLPLIDAEHPLRVGKLISKRLVLLHGRGDSITITDETRLSDITDVLYSLVDRKKTDVTFINTLVGNLSWDAEDTGDLDAALDIWGDWNRPDYQIQAAGFIISQHVGKAWQFSNCQLVNLTSPDISQVPSPNSLFCYGQLYAEALPSYLHSAASLDSDLYLEQGGSTNQYGGDSSPAPAPSLEDYIGMNITGGTWENIRARLESLAEGESFACIDDGRYVIFSKNNGKYRLGYHVCNNGQGVSAYNTSPLEGGVQLGSLTCLEEVACREFGIIEEIEEWITWDDIPVYATTSVIGAPVLYYVV